MSTSDSPTPADPHHTPPSPADQSDTPQEAAASSYSTGDNSDVTAKVDQHEQSETKPQHPLQGLRILVVDDHADNRRLFDMLLTFAGAEVETRSDGRLGVDAVAEAASEGVPFDLVLMDLQMPRLDGFSATRLLRLLDHTLPILAVSANHGETQQRACLHAGCNELLPKPVSQEVLIEKCQQWTRRSRSQ